MPTTNSGFFIQSTFGTKGNFDAVFPGRTSGLAHVWRDNDNPALPWSAPQFFATGTFSSSSLIQSNFGTPGIGNLEVVAKTGNNLVHFWRNDQTPLTWSGPTSIAGGVSGNPALIQGRFGTKGNFEMVAPLLAGGIGHWWRDNDAGNIWHGPTSFATGIGPINGVALIQSNFGTPGNREVGEPRNRPLLAGQRRLARTESHSPAGGVWRSPRRGSGLHSVSGREFP